MNARWKRDLSISYVSVGDILAKQGNAAGSLERHRMAQSLLETLAAADTADVRSRQDLSMICQTLGDALLEQGRFSEARKNYARAVAIAEEVSRIDPINAEARARLAGSYESLGSLEERIASAATNRPTARRNWLEARSWYERSRTVWLELRKQNAVAGLNEGQAQELAEAISRCDSALRK